MSKKISSHFKSKLVLSICIITLLAIGSVIYLTLNKQAVRLPASIISTVNYPLYTPSDLPKGYQQNEEKTTTKEGVTIFVISKKREVIYISQQKKPNGFDYEKFYEDSLNEKYELLTPSGKATLGRINQDSHVVSIETPETWIFANSNSTAVPFDTLEILAKSFEKID